MYDWIEIRMATDALWSNIRCALKRQGIVSPEMLDRDQTLRPKRDSLEKQIQRLLRDLDLEREEVDRWRITAEKNRNAQQSQSRSSPQETQYLCLQGAAQLQVTPRGHGIHLLRPDRP